MLMMAYPLWCNKYLLLIQHRRNKKKVPLFSPHLPSSPQNNPGQRGQRVAWAKAGLLAKLSHCDSKSSFNKVHAVYNFIIFC